MGPAERRPDLLQQVDLGRDLDPDAAFEREAPALEFSDRFDNPDHEFDMPQTALFRQVHIASYDPPGAIALPAGEFAG